MYSKNSLKTLSKAVLLGSVIATTACTHSVQAPQSASTPPPNVILLMSDDQGWGDVGYNGNPIVKTPSLDAMAAEAVKLDRFYAAFPVCSPTRANVLTGRHPFRYGITWAGVGHLPDNEMTLAEVLGDNGYETGHFGKWHVGELSKTINQSYFAGDLADPNHYSPPWENGFDRSFSTESMVPTYNPYYYLGPDYGEEGFRHLQTEPVELGARTGGFRWRDHYWTGPGQIVDQWLEGDTSEILMDQAIDFIDDQVEQDKPFMAAVWFQTPHTPLVASDSDREPYAEHPITAQHFYGSITAMDRQIGRLCEHLEDLGIDDNTIIWFKSDNGPSYIHDFNSSGPFSGKKSEVKEGGIRVPSIIEWPAQLAGGRSLATPMSTSDIYPTILAAANIALPEGQPKLDGENILPVLKGEQSNREQAIAFQAPMRGVKYDADNARLQYALSGDRYKLHSSDNGNNWQLFDLVNDPGEKNDISRRHPEIVSEMREQLMAWVKETEIDARDAYYFIFLQKK